MLTTCKNINIIKGSEYFCVVRYSLLYFITLEMYYKSTI